MTTQWPLQSACDSFYGNPRGQDGRASSRWESANLVRVACPWTLRFEGRPVKGGILVHRKVAESLERILADIWERCGRSQAEIDSIGMSVYGGAYNFRPMRGSSRLSMHSYGIAIDFDPDRNAMGDTTPAMDRRVIEAFEAEGWEWGGHWKGRACDGMHFQAAWTRATPPRLPPAEVGPGVDLVAVQTRLRDLGYHEVGMVDGKWGHKTKGALGMFQEREGLPFTGLPDAETLARLQSATPRAVSATRATVTPVVLRQSVPSIGHAYVARVWSGIGAAIAAVVAAVNGVMSLLGDAISYLAPLKQLLGDVPSWVWALGALGVALGMYASCGRAVSAGVEAVRSGEAAGPSFVARPD